MNRPIVSLAVAILSAVVLVGCSDAPDADPGPEPPDLAGLTSEWPCGYGFWVGNADQTVAVRLGAVDVESLAAGEAAAVGDESSSPWTGVLIIGRDLYANWCDDVIEPNEPEPVVAEQWQVSGTVEVTGLPAAGECGPAQGWARGLVARSDDGRTVEIGDLLVTNTAWGCFAG